MKVYNTCFIGIPLPKKCQQAFEALLKDAAKICPKLELVDPSTPHITVYYLDLQSHFNLIEIAKSVELAVGTLKDTNITVGSFDYFGEDDPGVLFLNVLYPKSLNDFNRSITKLLKKYFNSDNDLPFHPHMTIARINTLESKKSFKESESKLKARLDKVIWEFPITEVVLYGINSAKKTSRHEKLITILIK